MEKPEKRFIAESKIEVRKSDGTSRTIGGYVTPFNKLSENLGVFREVREKVNPGAFTETLKQDDIRAFWNHNSDIILGRNLNGTLKLLEDDYGLSFELDLPDTTAGIDAFKSIQRGDVNGMSFGFIVRSEKVDMPSNDKDPIIRTLLNVQLLEVSPVIFPAYPDSEVQARGSLDEWAKSKLKEDEIYRKNKEDSLILVKNRQEKLKKSEKDADIQKKYIYT